MARALICLSLLLAIEVVRGGFVQLAYTHSMYGAAYAMCISPCAREEHYAWAGGPQID